MDLALNYTSIDSIEGSAYIISLLIFIFIMNVWIIIPSFILTLIMIKWTLYNKIVLIESKRLDMVYKSPLF